MGVNLPTPVIVRTKNAMTLSEHAKIQKVMTSAYFRKKIQEKITSLYEEKNGLKRQHLYNIADFHPGRLVNA